jgi:hypothetical protein
MGEERTAKVDKAVPKTVGQLLDQVHRNIARVYGEDALTKTVHGAVIAVSIENPHPDNNLIDLSASLHMHASSPQALAVALMNLTKEDRAVFFAELIANIEHIEKSHHKTQSYFNEREE